MRRSLLLTGGVLAAVLVTLPSSASARPAPDDWTHGPGRPVPMPHVQPTGLPPVPIPHLRPHGLPPVPMPHLLAPDASRPLLPGPPLRR